MNPSLGLHESDSIHFEEASRSKGFSQGAVDGFDNKRLYACEVPVNPAFLKPDGAHQVR